MYYDGFIDKNMHLQFLYATKELHMMYLNKID